MIENMDRESFVILELKNNRDGEEMPSGMEHVFSALGTGETGRHRGFFSLLFGAGHSSPRWASFELVSVNGRIHFILAAPRPTATFLESQLTAHYPKITLSPVPDYAPHFLSLPHAIANFVLGSAYYYPLKTYKDVRDLDMLAGLLGQLAKLPKGEAAALQLRVSPAGAVWQRTAVSVLSAGVPDPSSPTGRMKSHPHARLIESKISQTGFTVSFRVVGVSSSEEAADALVHNLAGSCGVFALGEGNSLVAQSPPFWQKKKSEAAFVSRGTAGSPGRQIFGCAELASLWHPPGASLAMIKNIAWGEQLASEAPDNLPVSTDSDEDLPAGRQERARINFFARTEFRNKPAVFGIKKEDRRKHLYVVGKTGTGKSTMIANLVVGDMKNHEGAAVVDPHGDLIDILLDFVPSHRINDVAYLDPSDTRHPFHLNPLEVKNEAFRELVASGIVSIFYKLYHNSWGPRLEYILRNTILTLLYVPDATLLGVPELLTNEAYRKKTVEHLADPVLKNYWINEFNKMSPQLRSEAISPILNKVGQFLSSQTIRNIVGHPRSTIDLETMMNEGKIVLVNLSQGKLGEDNSALLGAMIITKIQLAAMNRVYQSEEDRRDFYLYVDEFQNFATNSFIKILSEARKYRLCLTLANQYTGQIDEDVQKAIFGNAGSIVAFGVGAQDARLLSREFGETYTEAELVSLGNYQIILKLSIDNQTSRPFSAVTLPLGRSHNQNRDKVIRSSRERYGRMVRG